MPIEDAALRAMDYAELTKLITRAVAVRDEREKELRAELEQKAGLLGLELHDNGKPRRRRRAQVQDDPEA